MRLNRRVETGRDRRALATDAGLGTVSPVSVTAGVLTGFGAWAALLGIASAIAIGINGGTDFSSLTAAEFRGGTAVIASVLALVSFIFGGYTAGRMSRRAGARNGL